VSRLSPSLAALLSFIFPGLGQAYAGDRRSALAQAVPAAIVVGTVLLLIIALRPTLFFVHLFQPIYAALAAIVAVALGLWRAYSIVHASRVARAADAAPKRTAQATVVALLLGVAVMHAWALDVVWSAYQAGVAISQPIFTPTPSVPTTGGATGSPTGEPGPTDPGVATPTPTFPPSPSPSPAPDGRVTILLLGRDLGLNNTDRLTDSIQVVSFDPRSGRIAFIGIPRDTGQLPLYNGGTYPNKINSLLAYADRNPEQFPEGGLAALRRELEYIIGIPIHYYASIDFLGFVRVVDALGGVDVHNDRPIADPTYWEAGRQVGFFLDVGDHHLDGRRTLAYVRSRHGPNNSDFVRARRQQQVILALRDKINDPQVLANLPGTIDTAAQYVRTDVPLDRLPDIVALLQRSTTADVERFVLQPRQFAEVVPRDEAGGQYMTRLKMDAVAELSIRLFGEESRYFNAAP
jgi:polyisoprenyl-teichoic acid--peptidoglycan teichoic acid transferase